MARILITGGFDARPPSVGLPGIELSLLASAEIYTPLSRSTGPALFSLSGDGQGQGAILHGGTAQVASSGSPAGVGDALEIYCTGLLDGSVIPPQVAIGGRMAEILYLWQGSGIREAEPGELSRAGRRCAGACRSCALDVPRPPEQ